MVSCLITGATGFLGSHVAERCVQRGMKVRVLARPSSDTRFLKQLPVDIFPSDIGDSGRLPEALKGIDVVIHCAAKVGDWGPVEEYRAVNVEALRGLLEACRGASIQRFVHLSSLGVYEARDHYGTDETVPLPDKHIDGYTQTKVESEKLVLQYHRDHGLPVVVLRPGFIYGPRDRQVLPKLVQSLRQRQIRYLGFKRKVMNTIYVGNLVDAILLALEKPAAVGQVYNLTDGESVSKKEFIEAIALGVGVPKPRPVPLPLWVAKFLVWWLEESARKRGDPQPPLLTQARLKFLGLNLDFSIEKARRELGYQPQTRFADGIRETVAWLKQNT